MRPESTAETTWEGAVQVLSPSWAAWVLREERALRMGEGRSEERASVPAHDSIRRLFSTSHRSPPHFRLGTTFDTVALRAFRTTSSGLGCAKARIPSLPIALSLARDRSIRDKSDTGGEVRGESAEAKREGRARREDGGVTAGVSRTTGGGVGRRGGAIGGGGALLAAFDASILSWSFESFFSGTAATTFSTIGGWGGTKAGAVGWRESVDRGVLMSSGVERNERPTGVPRHD